MLVDSDNPNVYYDHGLMAVVDSTPSTSAFASPAAAHKALSSLFASLISTLPISMNADHGPILSLPLPSTPLPRAKSLPKPKPLTKWQQFARKKGISENKKKEGKLVYDEDTKEWVPRWGYKGANKKEEEEWIHEVPSNKDDDYDPSKAMKAERKKRRLRNESQRLRNEARNAVKASSSSSSSSRNFLGAAASLDNKAVERSRRKAELETLALRNRASTASMGKFDKYLDGESTRAPKGTTRNFGPNEGDARAERKKQMAILGSLDGLSSHSRSKGSEGVLNERKAVRFASKGEGALSLARKKEAAGGGKRKRV